MGPVEILCGFAAIFLAIYYYFTLTFDFWKNRGVPGPRPIPFLGNIKDAMFGRASMGDLLNKFYETYKDEPMFGIFARRTPILVLNESEFIKDVLIKDFSNFANRGLTVHERTEPLSQHLFSLEQKRWRPLRMKLSPVFTSGKLKEMFALILECSEHLEKYMETVVAKGEPIECRDLAAKFTTDVIGSCAFGIEMNSLSEKDSEFRTMGKQIFKMDFWMMVRFRIRQSAPWLYNLLGYVLPWTSVTKFFMDTVKETLDYREKHKIVRNDFINVLLEMKNNPDKLKDIQLTDGFLAAQAFVFFSAGFETSSTTISNALYELAQNHDIQDKLRQEIKEEYDRSGGDLKYENIKGMNYLDAVFRETLRKYPPVTFLMRQSTTDYTFNGTKVSIPKGQNVWIPIYAIQHNSSIFSNAETFDPERFNDKSASIHPMSYLPFGDGPRNCIGARFAVYQSKIGLIKILRNYKVDVCEKTKIPYEHDPTTFLLAPKGGIYLKITKI